MFLLARLFLNLLTDQPNGKGVRKILATFYNGPGSNSYAAAYHQAAKWIESQSPEALELARQTIGWITNAKRLLAVRELEEAPAVKIGTSDLDETNIGDLKFCEFCPPKPSSLTR